jgi:NADH:ubiquinone oxidoreductase subunit 4 (subunit M)
MDTNQLVLLLILFSPLIAAALVLIIGKLGDGAAKWSALLFSLVPLALTIYPWIAYQRRVQVRLLGTVVATDQQQLHHRRRRH